MRPSTLIAALFASGALAAPLQANKLEERALVYHTEVEVVTITVTAGYGAPTPPARKHKHKPKPQPKPAPAPAPPAPVPAPPAPAPAPPAPAPAPPAPAPAPYKAPAPAPKPAEAASSGNSMLDVVNKYRRLYGLSQFTWSDECAADAKTTGEMNGGSELIHAGRPIDNGQVIGPGAADNFEMAYVGGWLCEVPDSRLGSLCKTMGDALHIDYQGQTGHNAILTDPGYKSIGCAWTQDASGAKPFYATWGGQWVCNFKY